jgi:hypothetical protein
MSTVLAWDSSGNLKIPTPIAIGDRITWKRNGTPGVYAAKVAALVTDDADCVVKLRIFGCVHERSGKRLAKARWIGAGAVGRVYRRVAEVA